MATAPLHASFAVAAQLVVKLLVRTPMSATPNTAVKSVITVTDANNSPVSNCSVVTVTVTFPDGSTQSFSLAGATVTNTGSGTYTIAYTTKGEGLVTEDWSVKDSTGLIPGDFKNTYAVSY